MDSKHVPDEYIAVSRDEFITGTTVPVDLFLKLSEEKYVLILKEGQKVQFDQMHFAEKADERQSTVAVANGRESWCFKFCNSSK